MSAEPVALRLAEWLDKCEPNFYGESSLWLDKVLSDNVMHAATELRRLHAENMRLQSTLDAAVAAARAEERAAERERWQQAARLWAASLGTCISPDDDPTETLRALVARVRAMNPAIRDLKPEGE